MRLNHLTDDLIQDFVDGNLSANQANQVQWLLDRNPQAMESAEQYRLVTRSLADLEPEFGQSRLSGPSQLSADDQFIDSIMARLPKERWWVSLARRDSLSLFAVLAVAVALIWLVDMGAVSNWLSNSLLPNFAPLAALKDAVMQVSGRLNGALPYLGFSVLVLGFYGLLDRVMAGSRRATRA